MSNSKTIRQPDRDIPFGFPNTVFVISLLYRHNTDRDPTGRDRVFLSHQIISMKGIHPPQSVDIDDLKERARLMQAEEWPRGESIGEWEYVTGSITAIMNELEG